MHNLQSFIKLGWKSEILALNLKYRVGDEAIQDQKFPFWSEKLKSINKILSSTLKVQSQNLERLPVVL